MTREKNFEDSIEIIEQEDDKELDINLDEEEEKDNLIDKSSKEDTNQTSNIMLDTYYSAQDGVMKWITRCFICFLLILSLGICTIFFITRNNYIQTSEFLEVQSFTNLIR